MTVVTRCPFLLTSNPVAPSLSLTLSGAGSLQVRVMEVVVRSTTARLCGGPVGTYVDRKEERRYCSWIILQCCESMARNLQLSIEPIKTVHLNGSIP